MGAQNNNLGKHMCQYFGKPIMMSQILPGPSPVHKSCTCALSRDNKHLTTDDQVYFYRCISWTVWPLRCIIRSARDGLTVFLPTQ